MYFPLLPTTTRAVLLLSPCQLHIRNGIKGEKNLLIGLEPWITSTNADQPCKMGKPCLWVDDR